MLPYWDMSAFALSLAFVATSQSLGLPPGLLSAVCYVESKHNPTAYAHKDGKTSSFGLCQVKEATARILGFKGPVNKLQDPRTNIYFAGKYLQYQLIRYSGDVRKSVSAYNAGTHRVTPEGRTRNVSYVSNVFKAWAEEH